MKYDEFVAKVRERGEYASRDEAADVARRVLRVLGGRLAGGEPKDLASQLPRELASAVTEGAGQTEAYGVQEFLRRVAAELNGSAGTAEWHASAVLSTVADAVTGGELNQVLSQLPSGYAPLFGRPGLV